MKIKKIFVSLMTLLLCGCSMSSVKERNSSNMKNHSSSIKSEHDNIKVVYFSCTKNTQKIAVKMANYLECSIDEIIPYVPYTNEDLDYLDDTSRANLEQNDNNARPAIQNTIDFNDIDTLFLGYPIWWGKLPKIIYTFLETYNFDSDTIIPFCTSGSSGISNSVSEIRQLEPNAIVLNGQRFASNASDSMVKSFIDSLNL